MSRSYLRFASENTEYSEEFWTVFVVLGHSKLATRNESSESRLAATNLWLCCFKFKPSAGGTRSKTTTMEDPQRKQAPTPRSFIVACYLVGLFGDLVIVLYANDAPARSFSSCCFASVSLSSRALLLLAAQGRSSRQETFDVATAHNGFSGIQPCDLGDEVKVGRVIC